MRWKVEVSDLTGNRRLLKDVLRELSLTLEEHEGTFLLSGPPLESLNTPSDVHAYVRRVSEITGEVAKHTPIIEMGFSVGAVLDETASGVTRHHFLFIADSVHLHASGPVELVSCTPAVSLSEKELRQQEELLKEHQYQALRLAAISRVVSAVKHERARTVQRLLDQEPTPYVLGHIAEVIQDDLGGELYSLTSKNEMTRFSRSINHPRVFGEHARHIVSYQDPPPNPMSLAESAAFIRELACAWLNLKAG